MMEAVGVIQINRRGLLRGLQRLLHAVELGNVGQLELQRLGPGEAHGQECEAVAVNFILAVLLGAGIGPGVVPLRKIARGYAGCQ